MDDETISNETDETDETEDPVDTEPSADTEPSEEEPVSYTAEEMYLLATQNQEDFSPYYRAIYAAAESGRFDITFDSVTIALSKDLKSKGYSITFDAWDGSYKVSWK